MKKQLSISLNQQLLQKRASTVLEKGEKLTLHAEKRILAEADHKPGFMGIVPLRCRLGSYYFLNLDDDNVAQHLFWFGSFGYERSSAALFTHLAIKANHVLDLGSCSGYYTLLASVLAKNTNTFAVEANPLNYHRLCENLNINGADAIPFHYALTPIGSGETIEIFYNANLSVLDTGSFAFHDLAEIIPQKMSKQQSFTVPAISFDSFMEQLQVKKRVGRRKSYALIKLDVEGLEIPLLEAMISYYSGQQFVVLIEILTPGAFQSIQSIVNTHSDFSIAYIREHDMDITLCDGEKYSRKGGSRNYVFGNKELISHICTLSPAKILEEYE